LKGDFLQYRNYFLSLYLKKIYTSFTYFGYFQIKIAVCRTSLNENIRI